MNDIFDTIRYDILQTIFKLRCNYYNIYYSEPKYVVIPMHFKAIISPWCVTAKNGDFDTIYGLRIIESYACETYEDISVY